MKKRHALISLLLSLFLQDISSQSLRSTLKKSNSDIIQSVLKNSGKYEVQILLTEVLANNKRNRFKKKYFNVNSKNYFYPASTVKLPIALLVIEKINENPRIDLNTKLLIEGDSIYTNLRNEIGALISFSSNESYNRLFEFLGQDYINHKLKEKGFKNFRIFHRLSTLNSDVLETKEVSFFKNDSIVFIQKGLKNNPLKKLRINKLSKGIGYIENEKLVSKAMNFSKKNYFSIKDLNKLISIIFFPKKHKTKKFNLTPQQLEFIKTQMSSTPQELGYDNKKYPDNYVKFFLFGDKKLSMDNLTMYNKVGNAYGYSIDNAYIYDKKSKKHFILTACIYTNSNNILNDDIYEYESIGIPFLAEIARELIYKKDKLQ